MRIQTKRYLLSNSNGDWNLYKKHARSNWMDSMNLKQTQKFTYIQEVVLTSSRRSRKHIHSCQICHSLLLLPSCRLLVVGVFGFGYNRTAWKKFTKETWKIKSEINCLFISNKNKYSRIKQVNFLLKLKLIGY